MGRWLIDGSMRANSSSRRSTTQNAAQRCWSTSCLNSMAQEVEIGEYEHTRSLFLSFFDSAARAWREEFQAELVSRRFSISRIVCGYLRPAGGSPLKRALRGGGGGGGFIDCQQGMTEGSWTRRMRKKQERKAAFPPLCGPGRWV